MSAAALGPRAESPAAPEALVLGALALGTALCTTWAVVAAGWNGGMSVALLTTSIAVVEAALLASSTASRLAAAAAAPLLGLLVVVPATIGGIPSVAAGDAGGLRHVVAEYTRGLTAGILGDMSWEFIVGFCGGMWVVGYLAAWLAVRERAGFFAVLPLYGVLASNAVNAPQLGPVAVPSLLAMGLSLLLLMRTTLAFLEWRWRGERVVALPGTRGTYARVAGFAAAGITLLAALAPPLTSSDVSGRLFHFNIAGGGSGGSGVAIAGRAAQQPGAIRFSPDTVPGGALVDDPQPVLRYTTDTSDAVYLRVVDDTEFSGGNWYPAERDRILATLASVGGDIPRDRASADGTLTATVRARIVVLAGGTVVDGLTQVPFPGEPASVDTPAVAHGEAGPDGALVTVDHVDVSGAGPGTLTAVGAAPAATAAQLAAAGTAYPPWVTSNYLGLPAATPSDAAQIAAIRRLAQSWTAGLTDPYDRARVIEADLRKAPFVYTLTPPAPPQGQWAITAFLLGDHQGYCQYFASSMGTMLRSLGIPARLVAGYGPGTVDDTGSRGSISHTVTTSDAHVWVEAYFPSYGWIPFEPTPPSAQGDYEPLQRPQPPGSAPTPAAASATTPTPSPTPTPRPAGAAASTGGYTPSGPTAALIATTGLVGGAAALVALALWWLLTPRTLRAMWSRMGFVGRILGARRRPSETLGGYCDRLARGLPAADWAMSGERAADDLRAIGALSGKAAFSTGGLTSIEVARWRRAWRGLVRLVPRLLLRRLASAGRHRGGETA